MSTQEPNSWPIRCHRTCTRELAVSCPSTIVHLEVEDHHLATFDASDTMNFWNNRVNIYDKLSLIAQDILAAPERGFSVCSLLTAGRRDRINKSLQM